MKLIRSVSHNGVKVCFAPHIWTGSHITGNYLASQVTQFEPSSLTFSPEDMDHSLIMESAKIAHVPHLIYIFMASVGCGASQFVALDDKGVQNFTNFTCKFD